MIEMVPALRFTKEFSGPTQPLIDMLALMAKAGLAARSGLLITSNHDTCTWALLNPGDNVPSSLSTLGELTSEPIDFCPQFWLDRPLVRQGMGIQIGGKRLGALEEFPLEQLCRAPQPFHLLIQLANERIPVSTEGALLNIEVRTDSREVADALALWLGGHVSARRRTTYIYDFEAPYCLRPPVSSPYFNSGGVLRRNPGLLAWLSQHPEDLDAHCLVCGEIGSGKTNTVKLILDRAIQSPDMRGLCVLDIKGEYASWAKKHGVEYLAVGADPTRLRDLGVNLFIPPSRQRLGAHIGNLSQLFTVGEFSAAGAVLPSYMRLVLADFYRRKWKLRPAKFDQTLMLTGQDLVSRPAEFSFSPVDPAETILDLFNRYWQRMGDQALRKWMGGHAGPNTRDIAAVLSTRIYSVRSSMLRHFDWRADSGGMDRLLDRKIVLSLQGLSMDEIQTLMYLFALLYVSAIQLEPEPPTRALRCVFVIEEAHRILQRPQGVTQELLTSEAHLAKLWDIALREYRSKGFGIVVADQSPSTLISAIMQANMKVVHRMPNPSDHDELIPALALPPDTSLSMLDKGECWIKQGPGTAYASRLPQWAAESK